MNNINSHNLDLAKGKAIQLSLELGFTDPTIYRLEDLALLQNIIIKEEELDGYEARLIQKEDIGLITIDSRTTLESRRRFSIAHEMGHFHLHKAKNPAFFCTEKMFYDWYKNNQLESEANAFAAEFLMPKGLFRKECGNQLPSFDLISSLSDRFITSMTSCCIRYVEIGPYPSALFATVDGYVKWIRKSHDFNYWTIQVGSEVSDLSCAGEYFSDGIREVEPQPVYAEAWLNDKTLSKNTFIRELPVHLDKYNTVLSLVWLEE